MKSLENQKPVAIIIVNWNQKQALSTCLNSLKNKTAYSNYTVTVLDNGSKDGSVELLKDKFPWINTIELDKNYGFAVGNNKGIAYAFETYKPDYVLLLNNDTEIIQADWLNRLVVAAEAENNIGIVGCKLIYPNGKTQYIGTKITVKGLTWLKPNIEANLPETFDVDAVLGACFLIKSAVIDKIGYLDTGFSPFVHEESDFCVRAKKVGYRTVMVRNVSIVHFWRASMSKVNTTYVESVVRRNTVRFMLLNFPPSWLLKRAPIELRILAGSFISRNKAKGLLPIKLRSGQELIEKLNVNIHGWFCNLMSLREILSKRADRTAKITAIE